MTCILRRSATIFFVAASTIALAPIAISAASPKPATWSVVLAPDPAAQAQLSSVSCISTTWCMTVGSFFPNGGFVQQTLIESWNGTAWSVVPSANAAAPFSDYLSHVSCVSVTFCMAVGWAAASSTPVVPIAEVWNGSSWSLLSVATTSATDSDFPTGVSCASPESCLAVGSINNNNQLAEYWNGTSWTLVAAPSTLSGSLPDLLGASCITATNCEVVGQLIGAGSSTGLTEQWNGTGLTVVSNPSGSASLSGVSCLSSSSCIAVGANFLASGAAPLALSWNGTSWLATSTPGSGWLSDVACLPGHPSLTCTAVGYSVNTTTNVTSNLAEAWNGGAWSIVPTPNVGVYDQLMGVGCGATHTKSYCTGVGLSSTGGTEQDALVLSS